MRKFQKIWKQLLSGLFAMTILVLCLFPYRALMNYHEQSHLFRWNSYYLHEQCSSWNGCAEYLMSFITQFFYIGWLGAAILALLAVLIQWVLWLLLKTVRMGKSLLFPITMLPPALLLYFLFIPQQYKDDSLFRESVEYDYLVRTGKWNKILGKSYHHPPETMNGIWCTNYALARKGMLLDNMFLYRQDGPDGLLMDALRMEPLALFSLSDIAFEIGLINSAERFAFDVKQRLPDNHKSGRIYQRLAEANMINGCDKVARKYMRILQSTLFYSQWADHYIGLLGNRQDLEADNRYGQLLRYRQKTDDQLAYAKDQILAELVKENPDNKLAADYLLAFEMLRLDLGQVTHYTLMLKDLGYERVPKAVQESIAGYWAMSHPNDSLPIPINKEIFHTTMSFLGTVNKTGNMLHPSLDVPPYSQSYWHYHAHASAKLKQQWP